MRKLYAIVIILICTLCFFSTQAQRKISSIQHLTSRPHFNSPVFSPPGVAQACDTVNLAVSGNWTWVTYLYGANDFMNGVNSGADKQKANHFDLSATSNTYMSGVFVAFGAANSSVPANLSKKIYFRVYADNAGVPGNLLTTEERTLSQIKADVDGGLVSEIGFASPLSLPSSKKFFVSVDLSDFTWGTDTIWVAGSADDPTTGWNQAAPLAWEQWSDDTWTSYATNYAPFNGDPDGTFDISLCIFPGVSATSTGCAALLPVQLLSFDAQRVNKDVTLTWQIADEIGMNAYEVERSDNNSNFKTVVTVPALNYAKNQSYSITDKNVFTNSSAVQYRLKQIDGDGSVNYSRAISVKYNSSISDLTFANPFNGALKLRLNLATPQPVSVYLYDMEGKLVASEKTKMYNASSNTIIVASTMNLPHGLYMMKIQAGTDQAVYKIVKQ